MGSREDQTGSVWQLLQSPELEDLLRAWARQIMLAMRTHTPATLVAYNPATNRAKLSVDILKVVYVTDISNIPKGLVSLSGVPPNAEATLAPAQLSDIPVQWPSTSKGWITFELTPGDTGLLHVSDRSLESYLLKGIPADPVFPFTHALKDSIWYPGMLPATKPFVPPIDPLATTIQGTAINLGPLATIPVALATPLITALDGFANATPIAGDGGAAIQTAFKLLWGPPGNLKDVVASTKTKSE